MNIAKVLSVPVKRDRKRRVGRGEGSGAGKCAGRGMRGAYSRTGAGGKIAYEGGQMQMFRGLPRRGFNNKRFRTPCGTVNLSDLAKLAEKGEITPELLRAEGFIGRKDEIVKVLGDGELTQALTVKAHRFSKSATEKIQAAGGRVEVIQ